jgi:CubicO group peptidase (beta-lactamase class C family)
MNKVEVQKKILDYLFSLSERQYFNGAVSVGYKGELLVSEGFGKSNFQYNLNNISTTKFKIGSITKSFTATCILQLYENGLIDIYCPINHYVDFPSIHPITIENLLTHSSGIPNFTSFTDYWDKDMRLPSSLAQTISTFKHKDLEFKPGTKFNYSNSGYLLLTQIIEEISGMSYGDYLKKNICHVIGLKNTGLDDGVQVIRDYSSGYTINKEIICPPFIDMSIPQGAYGMYSTVEDLFLFDKALHSRTILSNKSREMMEDTYFQRYGYGWFIYSSSEQIQNSKCLGHYGDINGYSNQVLRFPEKEVFISVLSNINITPADTIAKNIAKIVNGEDISIPERTIKYVDISEGANIVGDYRLLDMEQVISVKHEDGRWFAIIPKRYGVRYYIEMRPIYRNDNLLKFATNYINEEFTFSKGNTIKMEYKDCNNRVYIGSVIDKISYHTSHR